MPLSIGKVTVDVSLCGSIPRSHLTSMLEDNKKGAPCRTLRSQLAELTSSNLNTLRFGNGDGSRSAEAVTTTNVAFTEGPTLNRCKIPLGDSPPQKLHLDSTVQKTAQEPRMCSQILERSDRESKPKNMMNVLRPQPRPMMRLAPSPPVIDPPTWAVPAKGEARLEPVCEAFGTHPTVELTNRPFYRIGRSPSSDVQLWHETSSRRHALLFHHLNGACYIVDCGSAHGTFVNGKRVRNTLQSGMVVPHRVRRGALIRFGGPGAPAFVLKSFSAGMSKRIIPEFSAPSPQEPENSLLHLNTRLNAFGGSNVLRPVTQVQGGGILRKRSFEDVTEEPCCKRQRCTSPPLAPTEQLRLVSPDNVSTRGIAPMLPSLSSKRRVTFNDIPQAFYPALVTPDVLSSDDEVSVD